jgi:hypothetical protein
VVEEVEGKVDNSRNNTTNTKKEVEEDLSIN